MRLEIKRNSLLVIPEGALDRAFIEDTLGLRKAGEKIELERINNVSLGFKQDDEFVLKTGKEETK